MYGRLMGSVRRLLHNENGNFAMFAAITIPVFVATASLAVDTTNVMSMKTRLQNAADATALATSTKLAMGELTEANAKAFANNFFTAMVYEESAAYDGFKAAPAFTVTSKTDAFGRTFWNVSVDVTGTQTLTPMARVVGREKMSVAIHGTATSAPATQSALSMMLVLDKSGSMDWNNKWDYFDPYSGVPKKIQALKTAVASLTDQLVKADPEQKYVRLGAVSFYGPFDGTNGVHKKKAPNWDPASTKTFVDTLTAVGGTDSSGAMDYAYDRLKYTKWNDAEGDAHKETGKSGLTPTRFIVFMTDGANNYSSSDTATKATCDDAKKKDIVIYTVAFMAPTAGQNLLKYCATDASHYFDAANNEELVKAFKNIGQKAANMVARLTE